MGDFFGAVFKNFFGYDIIILLAAVFTGYIYYKLRDSTEKLRSKMTHTLYVPRLSKSRREINEEIGALKLEEVISLNRRMESFYSVFTNMTAIFPLLGILGTVISLLKLASDMENITGNFYAALTSTFWGLIFAIAFKFIDGLIAPDIEYNERSVEMFFGSEDAAAGDSDEPAVPEEPEKVPVISSGKGETPALKITKTVNVSDDDDEDWE